MSNTITRRNAARIASGTALAFAMGAALTLAAGPGTTCAGTSKMDHQGNAWSLVPKGSCEKTASPTSSTGFGQLAAFKEKMS